MSFSGMDSECLCQLSTSFSFCDNVYKPTPQSEPFAVKATIVHPATELVVGIFGGCLHLGSHKIRGSKSGEPHSKLCRITAGEIKKANHTVLSQRLQGWWWGGDGSKDKVLLHKYEEASLAEAATQNILPFCAPQTSTIAHNLTRMRAASLKTTVRGD